MTTRTLAALVLACGAASLASAGTISISNIGGGITLNSGPMGPDVFGVGQTSWTHASLQAANALLFGSGIDTNGRITILAADTTHGLSLMALFDRDVGELTLQNKGYVELVSAAHGHNVAYFNDQGGNMTVTPTGPMSRSATGVMEWNAYGGGNGFAWANLEDGNTMTFRFNKVPDMPTNLFTPSFQFATWTGTAWTLIPLSAADRTFTSTEDYGFTGTVSLIPLPSAAAMAGLSLLGLSITRRRTRG